MRPPYWKIGILSAVAIVLLGFGIPATILWSSVLDKVISDQLILSPTSKSFEAWHETPVPMYLKLYMFNCTNPEAFGKGSSKPKFSEMGPYVFRETDYKIIKSWNDNGTVTFHQKKKWIFQPDLSNGLLTDEVTNLNPVATTLAYQIRNENPVIKFLCNGALKAEREHLFITKPVNELLFDGYNDKLLSIAKKLNKSSIPFDKFGWFYMRNNSESYDGIFNMQTGKNNIHDSALITEWGYKNSSSAFKDSCSAIDGSLGDLWPPLINNETVSVFSPDICTKLNLKLSGPKEFLNLVGVKYASHEDMLDNGTNVPSRKCYCQNVECQPSGTLNVSSCKFGAPAFISLPHFYLADSSYRQSVDGMKPDNKTHEFWISIEPNTGIPMQVHAALQLNLLVQPDKHLDIFKDIPKTYIPMLWFKQEANLTVQYIKQAKMLTMLPTIGYVIFSVINFIGVMLMSIAIFIFVRHRYTGDGSQTLIVPAEE